VIRTSPHPLHAPSLVLSNYEACGEESPCHGEGSGIGQAIAIEFAKEGADVVVNYRGNPSGAEETRASIEKTGRRSATVQADVSVTGEARRLVADSIAALGGLDILVNNAGIEKRAPFLEVTEQDYRSVVEVNMNAPFFLAQAFVQHLRDTHRPGRVVNVSSVHEELPFPHFTSYAWRKVA
jgi:glucose 1-dehydrogenase